MLLDDNYHGAEPKLDEFQIKELDTYLEEYIVLDAKSVAAHIYRQYGMHYSISGVTDLLHRLGFCHKKTNACSGQTRPRPTTVIS